MKSFHSENSLFKPEHSSELDAAERQSIIKSTLSIYRDEFVGLRDFEAFQDSITGYFLSDCYPFTKPGFLNYLTAPMATLYISQLGYVLARLKFESFVGESVTAQLFKGNFFELRDEGKILITNIGEMKFKKKLRLGQEIRLDFKAKRTLWTENFFAIKVRFSFEDEASSGDFTTIITK